MIDLKQIAQKLESLSDDARFSVWMDLYQLASQDEESLQRMITSDDAELKIMFTKFLAHLPEEPAIRYLRDLLLDSQPDVVRAACKAFDKNTYDHKLKHLLPVINAPVEKAQYFAIEKLARTRDKDIIDLLIAKLPEASDETLIKIWTALRYFPEKKIMMAVPQYLEHPNEEVRYRVALVIGLFYKEDIALARKYLILGLSDSSARIRKTYLWSLRKNIQKKDIKYFMHYSAKDPDALVRQEGFLGLKDFPSVKVIHYLLNTLALETDRRVTLKVETVLLSLSPDQLHNPLKQLIKSADILIKNYALVLYAKLNKDSEKFCYYLIQQIKKSHSEKDQLPYLEALGYVWEPSAVIFLEKCLQDSPVISYVAMSSLLKLWLNEFQVPILKYLSEPSLSALLKQMILKYLIKSHPVNQIQEKQVEVLSLLMRDENFNIRYLAMQAAVKSNQEALVSPLLESFLNESDVDIKNLLKDHMLRVCARKPEQFVKALELHQESEVNVIFILNIIKESNLNSEQIQSLLPILLKSSLDVFHIRFEEFFADILISFLMKGKITADMLLETVNQIPKKQQMLALLLKLVRRHPWLQMHLQLHQVEKWFQEEDDCLRETIIELLGFSKTHKVVPFLVSVVCEESLKNFHQKAALTLNQLIEMPS